MNVKPEWLFTQSGVVPWRYRETEPEILLITTRKRKHWTIPKGVVEFGMTAQASAAKEALEEAGIRGHVSPHPLGDYEYAKWGGICTVTVFPMRVLEVLERWEEMYDRDRRWFSVADALEHLPNSRLRLLIADNPDFLNQN